MLVVFLALGWANNCWCALMSDVGTSTAELDPKSVARVVGLLGLLGAGDDSSLPSGMLVDHQCSGASVVHADVL